jgi:FKBP-type peptidyl-prolyl cis-trans isomerase
LFRLFLSRADKYGARADRIGPHEVLLFKLRLLAIAPGSTSSLSDENDDWSVPRSWQHPVHRHPDALAADAEATRLAAALQAEHAANTERLVQEGRRAPNEEEKRAAAEQIQRLAQQAQAEEAQKQQQQQQQERQPKQPQQPPIKVAPHGAPADVKAEL